MFWQGRSAGRKNSGEKYAFRLGRLFLDGMQLILAEEYNKIGLVAVWQAWEERGAFERGDSAKLGIKKAGKRVGRI